VFPFPRPSYGPLPPPLDCRPPPALFSTIFFRVDSGNFRYDVSLRLNVFQSRRRPLPSSIPLLVPGHLKPPSHAGCKSAIDSRLPYATLDSPPPPLPKDISGNIREIPSCDGERLAPSLSRTGPFLSLTLCGCSAILRGPSPCLVVKTPPRPLQSFTYLRLEQSSLFPDPSKPFLVHLVYLWAADWRQNILS